MTELNKIHIENLVTHFYQKIQKDDLLGPIFNEVAQVNWDEHIPLLCKFWNSIMLKPMNITVMPIKNMCY